MTIGCRGTRHASTTGMRILVIDDEADLRDLYDQNLSDAGHDVVKAANGAEGLAKLRACHPDLVLVDLMMPVMDGYEFLQRMRQLPGCERTPALVLSAVATGGYSQKVGASGFVPKPFDADALLDAVERFAA